MNKRKSLPQKFIEFNAARRMAGAKKKTLLAVSGGMDSVVMCDLFHAATFPFAIAHCNFQLRGKESDGDEELVKSIAKKYGVEFFAKKFETEQYAKEKNISIQLAARELRYTWFEEVRKENFNLVATAHHLNDNIETIIYNLTKGTGIKGLRGIPARQGNIIRPLLFASREEIESYCKKGKLEYREDSSNAEDKYTRNKIRHHIIPLLKEINPSLETTFAEKIDLFNHLETLYENEVRKFTAKLFLPGGSDIYIPIRYLKKLLVKTPTTAGAANALFEYLKDFGFNAAQVSDMIAAVDAEPGRQFLSSQARIIKDRKFFILTKLADVSTSVQFIQEEDEMVMLGKEKLKIEKSEVKITADKNSAFVDKAKLEFPLIARHWKKGDYFYPFGMGMNLPDGRHGKKKLKKFFADEKIPLHQKENIWVIESNKKIVWVVGYRIDERFKVTERTTEVLKMQLK